MPDLFRKANLKVVRVSEPPWGNLEMAPGQYEFGWLKAGAIPWSDDAGCRLIQKHNAQNGWKLWLNDFERAIVDGDPEGHPRSSPSHHASRDGLFS
jgi:hypothetical protein